MSPEEGSSFFVQLLHGLLHSLQPVQVPGQPHLQGSPLREPSKEVLAATCQLLGPKAFLQQVLGSVPGLGSQSASLDPKQLEVCMHFICSSSKPPQAERCIPPLQCCPQSYSSQGALQVHEWMLRSAACMFKSSVTEWCCCY